MLNYFIITTVFTIGYFAGFMDFYESLFFMLITFIVNPFIHKFSDYFVKRYL